MHGSIPLLRGMDTYGGKLAATAPLRVSFTGKARERYYRNFIFAHGAKILRSPYTDIPNPKMRSIFLFFAYFLLRK